MSDNQGRPSKWLLNNSKGYPDFLFTILTYSMILLIFVSLTWIAFGLLSFVHAGTGKDVTILQIMDSMKTGLISLAGVIFGLAGSYTVRRFKRDDHFVERKKVEQKETAPPELNDLMPAGLTIVQNEEDI